MKLPSKQDFFEEFLGSEICEKASLVDLGARKTNFDNAKIVEKSSFEGSLIIEIICFIL